MAWERREEREIKRFRSVLLCFDEGTDDNDAEMWEYCIKLKLLLHVNVYLCINLIYL